VSQEALYSPRGPWRQALKLHARLRENGELDASTSPYWTGRAGKVPIQTKVPGIQTAKCRCKSGEETVRHMALYCTDEIERRQGLQMNGRLNYGRLIGTACRARLLTVDDPL
jgi:hypothetical protein